MEDSLRKLRGRRDALIMKTHRDNARLIEAWKLGGVSEETERCIGLFIRGEYKIIRRIIEESDREIAELIKGEEEFRESVRVSRKLAGLSTEACDEIVYQNECNGRLRTA